jgi:hypothetical protein
MLKEYAKSLDISGFQPIQHSFKMQKKMTASGLAHRKRSGETNPFEVNVSNAIEHYITRGLALPYPFLKVQVI